MEKIRTYDLRDIEQIVSILYTSMHEHTIYAFTGSLGAGKTTIIREILKRCGVHDQITSPTFTYVNRYENEHKDTFYHFDCYRLATVEDFIQLGFYEYIYQPKAWSFIEWPEVISPILPASTCHVMLQYKDERQRTIEIR